MVLELSKRMRIIERNIYRNSLKIKCCGQTIRQMLINERDNLGYSREEKWLHYAVLGPDPNSYS
jgi:hypothetical protein